MYDTLVKAWAHWGDYLDQLFVRERSDQNHLLFPHSLLSPVSTTRIDGPSSRVTGFHYPSTRPVISASGNACPSTRPVNSASGNACPSTWPVNSASGNACPSTRPVNTARVDGHWRPVTRQLGPSTRVVETGLKSHSPGCRDVIVLMICALLSASAIFAFTP